MTRRIAKAILLSVWTILLITGTATYLVTRAVLLIELDRSLVDRAALLPQLMNESGRLYQTDSAGLWADDRYIVSDDQGRTMSRSDTPSVKAQPPMRRPTILGRSFVRMQDGSRYRTLRLRAHGRPIPSDTPDTKKPDTTASRAAPAASTAPTEKVPVTIVFRGSAKEFDSTMSLLFWALIYCGVAGGIVAAIVARRVAATALRPLHRTADVVGTIDERALDRRIDIDDLPEDLKPVGLRLNEMLARLEDAFERRRQFLANASHELRTPIAAMLTTLEVALRRPRDSREYREALAVMLGDAQHMKTLIDSLLTQARADIRALDEEPVVLNVADVVENTLASVAALAEEKSVGLERRMSPARVRTQPARLRSVLVNLIGNAIEHNRADGHVTVTTEVRDGRAVIEIADDGPGIPPEHLSHVFEPFYRVEGSRHPDGHLGLGLFLVKSHVEMLGGQITVQSKVGAGTTFTVTLSCDTGDADDAPDARVSQLDTSASAAVPG